MVGSPTFPPDWPTLTDGSTETSTQYKKHYRRGLYLYDHSVTRDSLQPEREPHNANIRYSSLVQTPHDSLFADIFMAAHVDVRV